MRKDDATRDSSPANRASAGKDRTAVKQPTRHWEDRTYREFTEELSTRPEQGLSSAEVAKRLEKAGPNSIEEEEESALRKLLSHSRSSTTFPS